MSGSPFIIRVYGIYNHPTDGVLVSDEIVYGKKITKFPGGGLEYGEGTIDCIQREMLEETGCEFKATSHFYTTDFFVESAFHDHRQVISIYYFVEPIGSPAFKVSDKKFDFEIEQEGSQSFRYIKKEKLAAEEFSLVIDQKVGALLKSLFSSQKH